MTDAATAATYVTATSVFVPTDWIPLTGTDGVLTKSLRAIRANAAGSLVCRLAGSTADRTLNFAAGETRMGIFTQIVSFSGSGLEGAI